MSAILFRARADLRSRWRSWVGLAVLVGLFGGAVTAAAAGARRTDTSYKRFLVAEEAPDLLINSSFANDPTFATFTEANLARLPGVVQTASVAGMGVARPADVGLLAPADTRIGKALMRKKILAGRDVRPDRADEVTISFVLARDHHLGVGDRLHLQLVTAGGGPATKPFTFRVVGVDAAPGEFPPQSGTGVDTAWATPAFYRAHSQDLLAYAATVVRLRHGVSDLPAFQTALRGLTGGKVVSAFSLADQAVNTQHSIHLQAVAVWMLAVLLALAAVFVLTQLLMRQSLLESAEYPDLRALGMSRWQLWLVGMLRGGLVALAGGVMAVVVAYLLSPLLPVGLARTAEIHPGFAADYVALGLGALATIVLVALTAAWPAWRSARAAAPEPLAQPAGRARPSTLAGALARAAAPAPVTTGVRLALEPGRGRTAVPVRSTVAGAVVGVAALATALGFTASLDHLLGTPTLYGVPWDAKISSLASDDVSPAAKLEQADSRVTDVSSGYAGFPITIGGTRVDGIAMDSVKGISLMPTPLRGRLPETSNEILLGSRTMAALHAHVGATVRARLADTPVLLPFRVVGTGVFPSLSDAMGLGKGAAMTLDGVRRGLPPGVPAPSLDTAFVRFHPGVDKPRAIADLNRRLSQAGTLYAQAPAKPVDLVNFGRVQNLPLVLAALLGGLAAATLANLLVTSIRRRRRDLAILKTLGFSSGQVRTAVAWQASTLAAFAVLFGIPAGVVAGRWVWILFAHQLGIVSEPTVPIVTLAVLVAAAVLVANLVALLPARVAARLRPALVLRSE